MGTHVNERCASSPMGAVPVLRPRLASPEAVLPYLRSMLNSHSYANFGPLVQDLESRYADFLGVNESRVVSCANATLALMGAIAVLPRERWITQAWSFPATAQAIVGARKELAFRDVGPHDVQLQVGEEDDPAQVGVVPVAAFGAELDLAYWSRWPIGVLDAAASLGTQPELGLMQDGWAVVFSLHATKVLGCGEGAIAVFGSPVVAADFRAWTTFGFRGQRESQSWGVNAKMPEVSAAYALAALDGWSLEREEWLGARALTNEVSLEMGLAAEWQLGHGVNPYWIVNLPSKEERDEVESLCSLEGIGTRRWWPSLLSEMPAFKAGSNADFPHAKGLVDSTLGLPFYRGLSERDVLRIAAVLSRSKP